MLPAAYTQINSLPAIWTTDFTNSSPFAFCSQKLNGQFAGKENVKQNPKPGDIITWV